MATRVVYSRGTGTDLGGYLDSIGTQAWTVRADNTDSAASPNTSNVYAENSLVNATPTYQIVQGFLSFDLNGVGGSISSVTVLLEMNNYSVQSADTVYIAGYDWGTSITTGDWRTRSQAAALDTLGSYALSVGSTPPTGFVTCTAGTDPAGLISASAGGILRAVTFLDSWLNSTVPTNDRAVGIRNVALRFTDDTTETVENFDTAVTGQTWTVPTGVTGQIFIEVWGAGANSTATTSQEAGGGGGGYAAGAITASPGTNFTLDVPAANATTNCAFKSGATSLFIGGSGSGTAGGQTGGSAIGTNGILSRIGFAGGNGAAAQGGGGSRAGSGGGGAAGPDGPGLNGTAGSANTPGTGGAANNGVALLGSSTAGDGGNGGVSGANGANGQFPGGGAGGGGNSGGNTGTPGVGKIRIAYYASAGTNANPTTVSSPGAVGTVSLTIVSDGTGAPTTVASPGTAGTANASISAFPTTVSAAGSPGTAGKTVSANVTTVSAAGSPGTPTLDIITNASSTPTGVASPGLATSPSALIQKTPTGVASPGLANGSSVAVQKTTTGVASTGAANAPSITIQSFTSTVSSAGVVGTSIASVSGLPGSVFSAGQVGDPTIPADFDDEDTPTGVFAPGLAVSPGPAVSITPLGSGAFP